MIKKGAHKPKIIVVCGPTGSGKTALAIELCKKFNGEIINADSRQVYKYMDIGTGKGEIQCQMPNVKSQKFGVATPHTIKGVRIHLIDVLEPDERYTVGRFKKEAEEVIEDILRRGKVPFIVGGTGLYIDALTENFSFPSENQESRIKNHDSKFKILDSKNNLKSKNLEDLVKLLEKLDPEALNIVDLKNRRRVERAIEVCLNSKIPFSQQRTKGDRKYDVLKLAPVVSLDREKLHEKINKRVDEMIEQGLEKEVQKLAKKYGWESEAMTGIGYREWREYMGNIKYQMSNVKSMSNSQISNDRGEVIDQIKLSTRKYAKRQMAWFKRDKEINYIDLKEVEELVKKFIY